MKTLKYLLFCLFLVVPILGISQTKTNQSQLIRNKLNKDNTISKEFKQNMIQISKNLNSCNPWIDVSSISCKNVKDPWNSNNNKLTPKNRQIASFKSFEKAISNGKGGKILPKKLLAKAQKKYPGYSQQAMQSRFKMIVKQMEWVHEDE